MEVTLLSTSPQPAPSPKETIISEAFTPKEGPLLIYSCHMASPSSLGGGESLLGVPSLAFQSTGHKNTTGSSAGPPALCNLIIFISQGLAQVLLHFVVVVITILNVLTSLPIKVNGEHRPYLSAGPKASLTKK